MTNKPFSRKTDLLRTFRFVPRSSNLAQVEMLGSQKPTLKQTFEDPVLVYIPAIELCIVQSMSKDFFLGSKNEVVKCSAAQLK